VTVSLSSAIKQTVLLKWYIQHTQGNPLLAIRLQSTAFMCLHTHIAHSMESVWMKSSHALLY